MKKKILSTIFMLCAGVCLGLGLTACGGGSEESDPIKYAQSILSGYGETYDYVYQCEEPDIDDYGYGLLTYRDFYYYVSTAANKTTITRTKYTYSPDSKDARTITDYYEVTPNGENVNVFRYDVNGLTYASDTLTQQEYQKRFPYLLEHAVSAFASFDPDNLDLDTDEQYFKREDTRVYQKKVDENLVTLENTCNYYEGGIPSGDERDKGQVDPNFKGNHTFGYTIKIDRETGHIDSVYDDYTNSEIKYSYNRGTKKIDTKYYATTKKEAAGKVLSDMTVSQPTGNYKTEGTVNQGGISGSIVQIYDAEKDMIKSTTKYASSETVTYLKYEINESATDDSYATAITYQESNKKKMATSLSKAQYEEYAKNYFSLNLDISDIQEENIEITHNVEDNSTIITLTIGENVITITFKGENDFSVVQEAQNLRAESYYTNHKLTRQVTEIATQTTMKSTTDVTYTYDNVPGFDFDESQYSE